MSPEPQAPARPGDGEAVAGSGRPDAEPSRLEPAALVPLVALTVVWCWWAANKGGYFSTVLLPGTIALCGALILLAWVAPWRGSLRLSRATLIALASLVALGIWAALSAIWSPGPDFAIADGQRILAYALAFGLGIWLCNLLGRRLHLVLVPLAVAGAFAGIFALVAMLTGSNPAHYLEADGTLEYPLGYRNANAAFFAIALWPALGIATRRANAWWVRAPALAAATLCLELAMLSQSRGSLLGGVAALVVYLAFARDRARRLGWLVLAVLPALVIIPSLVDLYNAGSSNAPLRSALDEFRGAGRAVLFTTLISLALGAAAALAGKRLPSSPRRVEIANRAAAVGLVVAVIGGSVGFVAVAGNPVDWIDKRVTQLSSGQAPNLAGHSSRFSTLSANTRRPSIWRVALLDAGNHPLLGDGGGGFRYHYLSERHRDAAVAVLDAHSVELENLSELGIPGLLLFAAAITAAGVGSFLARKRGPEPALVSMIALTAGAYWLAHSSIDWFWPYPAVTAPVLALLGSACAPALRTVGDVPLRRARWWLAAGALVLAISTVPPFLSQRYVDNAYAEWPSDPTRAYDDLDRAQSLNPLAVNPLLAEGAIARANGDRRHAIDAFRRAADKRPEEWAAHYFLAQLYLDKSPRLARAQLALAKAENPFDPQVLALESKLRKPRPD